MAAVSACYDGQDLAKWNRVLGVLLGRCENFWQELRTKEASSLETIGLVREV